MQPSRIIASSESVPVTVWHSAAAPCNAFLDFDPILPGWPEEPAEEDGQRDPSSASVATPPVKPRIAVSKRRPSRPPEAAAVIFI